MGSSRVLGAGTAIFLVAAGAVLRFAIAATSAHGLNMHVMGVILMLVGAIGLVLSLLASRPLSGRAQNLIPASSGHDSRRVLRRKAAATADVAAILDSGDRDGADPPVLQDDDLSARTTALLPKQEGTLMFSTDLGTRSSDGHAVVTLRGELDLQGWGAGVVLAGGQNVPGSPFGAGVRWV